MHSNLFVFDLVVLAIGSEIVFIVGVSPFVIYKRARVKNITTILVEFTLGRKHGFEFAVLFLVGLP